MNKLILIDGNSLVNRAFYALPFFTNRNGEHTGAVFGFSNMLLKLFELQKPTHVVVAFDYSRKTFRSDLYPDYKGTRRETPPELLAQLDLSKTLLDNMDIKWIWKQGVEGDDIIGTLAKRFDGEVVILTGDRDELQLVDDNTTVLFTRVGITDTMYYTKDNMIEKCGMRADQIVDYKALMGDKSDNIPGVSGIGKTTANSLLNQYGTLNNIYEHINEIKPSAKAKLEAGKDLAYLSQTLARIKTDCDIDFDFADAEFHFSFQPKLRDFMEDMEFWSALKRYEQYIKHDKSENEETPNLLNSIQDLDNFANQIQTSKQFGFSLQPTPTFAFDKQTYSLGEELDKTVCLEMFKTFFEDEQIQKITFDLKSQLSILEQNNINISKNNIFDCAIASYLIWAGTKSEYHNFSIGNFVEKQNEIKDLLKQYKLEDLYNKIELPLTFVLYDMEKSGFKIDANELDVLKKEYEEKIEQTKNQLYQMAGEKFNLNSPMQIAYILFDKLGIKCPGKKRSTSIEVLNEILGEHPIVQTLIDYRRYFKMYSTYILPYKEILERKGEIINTVFNQTLTATGRLSSSDPNLQNIPIRDEDGKNIRKIFISRFSDGVIMSADYNQIELRLLANFSEDQNMIGAFVNNIDIHTKTASEIFGVPPLLVTSQMRRDAKSVNFGIVYGISDFGLAKGLGIPIANAKEYMQKYFASYPSVKVYQQRLIEYAKQNGFTRTKFGRIRRIPEINATNFGTRQFGERIAINAPLQGTASDIIKIAMIRVYEKLKEHNLKAKLILQVHDELILDVPSQEIEECENILKDCMENVVNLKVHLPVSISYGKNWFYTK